MQLTDNPKNTRGGNNTAISLANNAGLPLLMAALQQSDITWLQCLQNSGAFLPHPVCKSKRPIPVERMGRAERRRCVCYITSRTHHNVAFLQKHS
jgi:hypothetical protein